MTATRTVLTVSGVVVIDLSNPDAGYDVDRRKLHHALAGIDPGSNVRLLVGERRWPDEPAVHALRVELPPVRVQVEGSTTEAVTAWERAIRNDPPQPWWDQDDPWSGGR